MLCYDGVLGRCFEANELDVREAVDQLNSKLKQNGYLFLGEYWEAIKRLSEYDGYIEPHPKLLHDLGFHEQENDVFRVTIAILDDEPTLIIQASYI